jgi:hypothetical protein
LVNHAFSVTRWLQCGTLPPLRTAYVEAVATVDAYRRRGSAAAVMRKLVASRNHPLELTGRIMAEDCVPRLTSAQSYNMEQTL